jgi:hypothetical protein
MQDLGTITAKGSMLQNKVKFIILDNIDLQPSQFIAIRKTRMVDTRVRLSM